MVLTVFLFASGVRYLLTSEPIMVWSFFFGLVIASSFVVAGEISRFGIDLMLAAVTGLVIGLIITSLVPVQLPASPWALFVGGAIAVCAWILPGISGSFILLILGLYAFVLDSISRLDVVSLGALAMGCAIGLVSFARLLSSLFRHFRNETLAVLTGFMLGSLVKLWPWKQTLSYQLRDDGSQIPLVQKPVMPEAYFEITGSEPQIAAAIGMAIFGLVIVFVIDWMATRRDAHEDPPTGNA
ncbi:MAG: DUF368 domain-containing protein, partial [Pseudomonadales bacterium]|nr:DUF368 domain-containing protein [Pseudomonadales bacterium]